jgi:hypothetical protein
MARWRTHNRRRRPRHKPNPVDVIFLNWGPPISVRTSRLLERDVVMRAMEGFVLPLWEYCPPQFPVFFETSPPPVVDFSPILRGYSVPPIPKGK